MALSPIHNHQHSQFYLPFVNNQQHMAWNSTNYSITTTASHSDQKTMLAPVDPMKLVHEQNPNLVNVSEAYYDNCHFESKYGYEFYQRNNPYAQTSPNFDNKSQTSTKSCTEPTRPRKNVSRRYKTPSPHLLRSRREAANARERKRMNSLNHAFDKLRTVLPEWDQGRRLSKYETLLMAQEYIGALNGLVGKKSSF